jgi:hypothetical protein
MSGSRSARFRKLTSSLGLAALAAIGSAAGCGGCPDVDCGGGAPVVVTLGGLNTAVSAEICFNGDCAPATMSVYIDGSTPNATRDLGGSGVQRGERFEVALRAFNERGEVVAEGSKTVRRKDDGDCGCDGYGIRWDGETLTDW